MIDATDDLEVAIIGAGPSGLAAAEMLVAAGHHPVIFEAKPSVARKFLMAGKSGLNLTKAESVEAFQLAIGCRPLDPILAAFGPPEIIDWAEGLGEPLFTGSSGRVFPKSMKGSPLLRRWLRRLESAAVRTNWQWRGWEGAALRFQTPDGLRAVKARAVVLALGGASWPRLGSDGIWQPWLVDEGVQVTPFRPANMGFDVGWSDHFRTRFAGEPVKPVALSVGAHRVRGEFVISRTGIEGSAVYALSARLRDALEAGETSLSLDLAPGRTAAQLAERLSRPRGRASMANHLRKTVGIKGVRAGLLREGASDWPETPQALAERIKALPLPVIGPRPLAEAISSAGGVAWASLTPDLMLNAMPGVFVAGEMLDWEAPTGGYLLTASISTGRHAGQSAARFLAAAQ